MAVLVLSYLRARVFGLALVERTGEVLFATEGFNELPGARRAVWEARCIAGEPGVERVLVVCESDGLRGRRWVFLRNPEVNRTDASVVLGGPERALREGNEGGEENDERA